MKKNGNDDAVNGLKVLELPEIYTLIDSSTRLPALSEGGACFIFTERGFADEALDWHLQRMRNWYVIAIEQKNIYPFLGSEFYNNGAHFVIIDDGQEGKETRSPEELVPRPDFSAVNELNTPVTNPDYVRALTMLQQELNWRVKYDGKQETLRAYEDNMIREFGRARFLVPFKTNGKPEITGRFDPGDEIKLASITNEEGRKALPVFSDWDQFSMSYDPQEWKGWVIKAEELPDLPADTVVLNPATLAFAMSKQFLGQMMKIYREEMSDDGKAGPGGPEEYPIPLSGGSLRERIEEMIDIAGCHGTLKFDIGEIRKLYASAGVTIHPEAEKFLMRNAYLFSQLSPGFGSEEEDLKFVFETFDQLEATERLPRLQEAAAHCRSVERKTGCKVTPFGFIGFGDSVQTIYIGECERLYALARTRKIAWLEVAEVATYDSLVDLLEHALEGHLPVGLDD